MQEIAFTLTICHFCKQEIHWCDMSALNRRSPDYLSKPMHSSMESLGVRHTYV